MRKKKCAPSNVAAETFVSLLFKEQQFGCSSEQRLSLAVQPFFFYSALHPWLAHYCQRFDVSPALSFVGHDGDSVSTL